jgi:uncharacterized membrane-anchored protein
MPIAPALTPALLPPDHPDRAQLAAEVHARPPEPLTAPRHASYVAVRIDSDARDAELAHLSALCQQYGVAPPPAGGTQWATDLGPLRLKWERHGEFSSYTFFAPGLAAAPFAEPAAQGLPPGWLAAVPGLTVCAVHAELASLASDTREPGPANLGAATADRANTAAQDSLPSAQQLAAAFGANVVVGASIGEGAGLALTDFVIHADGFARFLLRSRDMTSRQAGRMLQRLFEIEAYRMMALLALPVARGLWTRLLVIERTLAELTSLIARSDTGNPSASRRAGADPGRSAKVDSAKVDSLHADDALLQRLMALAAEVENALAASQARFSASRAYHALVTTRITELREQRIPGLQTIDEFMARRLSPAMATCATVSQRLHNLSERVAQVSSLLSTRVDITRQQQNQALLAATAHRAKLQLRLQQTVEGLSVAAIVYYLTGLVGYGAKALKAAGLGLSPDLLTGIAVPLLGVGAWWVLRRVHRRIAQDDLQDGSRSF